MKVFVKFGLIGMMILVLAGTAQAWTELYTSGNWSTGSNWSTGAEPTASGDPVLIRGGRTAQVTLSGEVSNGIYLGYGSGAITMTGGDLTDNDRVYVGDAGTGTFTQSDGTHTINGALIIANRIGTAGDTGTYTLSGGSLSSTLLEVAVQSGTLGSFIQTGGTNTTGTDGSLYVGYNSGSNGTFSISGGSLSIGLNLLIGRDGSNAKFEVVGSGASTIVVAGKYYAYNSPVTLESKIDGGGVSLIDVTGTNGDGWATIDGTWNISDIGAPSGVHKYDVLRAATGIYGDFDTVNIPSGWAWGVDDTSTVDTLWVETPEPATLLLLGLGGIVASRRRS